MYCKFLNKTYISLCNINEIKNLYEFLVKLCRRIKVSIKSFGRKLLESNLLMKISIALVLGVVLGIMFPNADGVMAYFGPLGELFIRLLKMIMLPVIICTLIVGASSISPSSLGKIGVKMILFYLFTTLCAIILGLGVGNLTKPGVGLELNESLAGALTVTAQAPSLMETFLAIIPTNFVGSISKGDVLPIIFFCLMFGIALAFGRDSKDEKVKSASDMVFQFFEGASFAIFKIVGWVMQYAPIGVFCLIFIVFSKNGLKALGPLANVTLSVYLGLILQIILVYCVICILMKLSPVKFISKVRAPMITAFVTRSSGATLPISMDVAENDMGIPKRIFGFTLPVGATINMDGTTIYLGVCALFIANAVGIDLSMAQQMTIIVTAVLASIGTAGVPGAGAIMLLMVLESVGLDVQSNVAVAIAYSMILGIDALLDMGRTSMNVVGDMIAAVFVAKTEDDIDLEKWK